jgi:hypothetical protein
MDRVGSRETLLTGRPEISVPVVGRGRAHDSYMLGHQTVSLLSVSLPPAGFCAYFLFPRPSSLQGCHRPDHLLSASSLSPRRMLLLVVREYERKVNQFCCSLVHFLLFTFAVLCKGCAWPAYSDASDTPSRVIGRDARTRPSSFREMTIILASPPPHLSATLASFCSPPPSAAHNYVSRVLQMLLSIPISVSVQPCVMKTLRGKHHARANLWNQKFMSTRRTISVVPHSKHYFGATKPSWVSVRTSQETHYVSATRIDWLMLFGETAAVYCENHMEHIKQSSGPNG